MKVLPCRRKLKLRRRNDAGEGCEWPGLCMHSCVWYGKPKEALPASFREKDILGRKCAAGLMSDEELQEEERRRGKAQLSQLRLENNPIAH